MKASIILGIVFGACVYTMAATWTGGGDGMSWGDPANWGGAVPGATEVVSVSTGAGAKTISIDATDRVIGELQLTGVGKLTITGAGVLSLSKLTSAR